MIFDTSVSHGQLNSAVMHVATFWACNVEKVNLSYVEGNMSDMFLLLDFYLGVRTCRS